MFLIISSWQRLERNAKKRDTKRIKEHTSKVDYYPLTDVLFLQRHGGGFYLEIKDADWVDCYFHIKFNKKIRMDEYGEYWGPLYFDGKNDSSRWLTLTRQPFVNDTDIIYIRLDALDFNFTYIKMFIRPFIACIHSDPAVNLSLTQEMYSITF